MKLLLCTSCWDIVAMWLEDRSCRCGASHGHYTDKDGHVVEVAGPCRVIGLSEQLRYGTTKRAYSYDCTEGKNVVRIDLPMAVLLRQETTNDSKEADKD